MPKARRSPRKPVPKIYSKKAKASLILGLLAIFTFVPALPSVLLALLSYRDIERSEGKLHGRDLARGGIITSVIAVCGWGAIIVLYLLGSLINPRDDDKTASSTNSTTSTTPATKDQVPPKPKGTPLEQSTHNLQTIAKAMKDYHDQNKYFPVVAAKDKDDRKLLSWRVELLRFLPGEGGLYWKFKMDEPWDSPHNKKLIAEMPKVYECPRFQTPGKTDGKTYYQGFAGPHAVMGGLRLRRSSIASADGEDTTFLVVEAGEPVPWTKPEDIAYSPAKPLPKLGGPDQKSFLALFVDGSVRLIPRKTDEKLIRAQITWDGSEMINRKDK